MFATFHAALPNPKLQTLLSSNLSRRNQRQQCNACKNAIDSKDTEPVFLKVTDKKFDGKECHHESNKISNKESVSVLFWFQN